MHSQLVGQDLNFKKKIRNYHDKFHDGFIWFHIISLSIYLSLFLQEHIFSEHLSMSVGWFVCNSRWLAYNRVHNILRLFDGWANFPFTVTETTWDYYC